MNLSQLRAEAGFQTQQQLSEHLGISRPQVARWESGQRQPRLHMVPLIAQALRVTESDVISAILSAQRIGKSARQLVNNNKEVPNV